MSRLLYRSLNHRNKNKRPMKRQSIMDTYKEIKAAYSNNDYESTREDKAYWVGTDENGIIKCTLCIQDTVGMLNLRDVVAVNSDQAKARYVGMLAEENNDRVCDECGSIHKNGISWHGRCYHCGGELVSWNADEHELTAVTPKGIEIYERKTK